jgi:chemotaxis protein MotB
MAAVMWQGARAVTDLVSHSSGAPRQTNDFIDRRAIVDVMSVMDSMQPQGSDDEIWMISYMDIMTLLLTLFVLLLAFAKITPQSTKAAPTIQAEKHVAVVKSNSSQTAAQIIKVVPIKAQSSLARAAVLPKAVALVAIPAVKTVGTDSSAATLALTGFGMATLADAITPPLKAAPQNVVPLRRELPATASIIPAAVAAREKLLASVRTSPLGQRIELSADQDNVSLEISDNILFDPGSATLKKNGQQLLDELAALLVAQDNTVSIEGHSDNVAFSNAHFASNWELSATRATNVTRYLITRGIAAARLRAIGYADTRPRADNASVQGRARNRRVSLVLHMPVPAAPADIPSGNNQSR